MLFPLSGKNQLWQARELFRNASTARQRSSSQTRRRCFEQGGFHVHNTTGFGIGHAPPERFGHPRIVQLHDQTSRDPLKNSSP
jgi:hypothetical protein